MSESKTRTVPTMYGEISVETVVCDSCGTEIRKEDAQRFVIGEVKDRRTYRALGEDTFNFNARTAQIGWACEYCREEGVFGFPESRIWDIVRASPEIWMAVIFVANFCVMMVVVVLTQI